MRSLCIGLCFLGAALTQACASEDPTSLDGSPLAVGQSEDSKTATASKDDTKKVSPKKHVATGDDDDSTTAGDDDDDGPVFVPTGTGTGGTGTGATTPASLEQQCVDTINQDRATLGLPALTRWTAEESCSDTESQNDSQSGEAHGSFGQCEEMAQNECPGYPSPADQNLSGCLAQMFAEGPGGGHYENMTSTQYTKVSCGVFDGGDGTFWAVQNFK